MVNLIPYNKVREHDQYERSGKERVVAFYDVLKKNHINCVVRKEFGHDIEAACGQLRSSQMKRDRAEKNKSLNKIDESHLKMRGVVFCVQKRKVLLFSA